jgi:deoxyribodipyrimidine photo-lyase
VAERARPRIIWFRTDLRLHDNPALHAAAEDGAPVIPLYVFDEALEDRPLGAASRWWLDKSLAALTKALEAKGSKLILRRGDCAEIVSDLAEQLGAEAVFWNRLYQEGADARDAKLQAALERAGVRVETFNGSLLVEPNALRTTTGGAYKVFTPFSHAVRKQFAHGAKPLSAPRKIVAPEHWPKSEPLKSWKLHPHRPDWSKGFDWTPGEAGARAALETFTEQHLADYPKFRDVPDGDRTSRLSPHLRWGEVSPRQVIAAARFAADNGDTGDTAVEKFVSELLWREFNRHILAAFPDLAEKPIRPDFARFPWRRSQKDLRAWRQGRTGYPIVDAGMRQLWTTGWMHNRVRMVTASFLVKHLRIDWREGERWFWDTLVDADPGNNPGNWQWSAGSGADAAPYFRIFSPEAQGTRFDPEGAYVRHWVPELKALPAKYIHVPWKAPDEVLTKSKVKLGETYPQPIVDHAEAREAALAAFAGLKN